MILNKKYKRIQFLLASFVIVFLLVGCGPTEVEDIDTTDTDTPVISGAVDIEFEPGDADEIAYLDGVTALDELDGDITSLITVDTEEVNLFTVGIYEITYTVTDTDGFTASIAVDVYVGKQLEADTTADLEELNFDYAWNFPTVGTNGTIFFWSSSNTRVMTDKGLVIPPPIGSGPETITMTVDAYNGIYSDSMTFEFVVEDRDESTVTLMKTLPFVGTSEEYVVTDDPAIDIFYVDYGNVPYINIETYIDMIDGAIDSDIIDFTTEGDDVLIVSYEVTYDDFDGTEVTDEFIATIDFTENTFTVNNYGFFENYVAETSTDYGEGLDYVDADYVDPKEVTIPLGEYSFDLVVYENDGNTYYLMPFHVANLLFAGGVYYDVYYNGDSLYGIDTFGISGGSEEDLEIQELVRTSSYNSASAPKDVKEATYHFMALALDYFYGLKEDQKVDTYYDYLSSYASALITKSDYSLYEAMFDIAYGLDDLHTSHVFPGYYNPADSSFGLSINDLGSKSTAFYEGLWDIQDDIEEIFGTAGLPGYELIDDDKTAIIYLEGFDVDTPDSFKAILNSLPSSVDNVVIDLAYNTGGNLGAVLRIFGYMTEEDILFHSQNPADDSAVTWYVQSSYRAKDYNWFIKTSSVTFSAANLMASMAQEMGIATIIGQDSTGGASSIGVIMAPDGTTLLISTNNVLSTRIGNETDGYRYKSIEYGIEVDYYMSNVYSETLLISVIEKANAANE